MGLKLNKSLGSGITLDGAYMKITNINGNKETLDLSICFYVNYQACKEGKTPVEYANHKFKPSVAPVSDNFLKQGYLFLKTLPEFLNALDVFEPEQI
ncbi:hypothetical protein MKX31_28740 [Bacillus sp. FSL M8-0063]|uniref:hypothetical protein n=1 Tax=Bacillus sp. FSL M8-0063 TaxID=2921566 RepID=UPI0030FBEEC2